MALPAAIDREAYRTLRAAPERWRAAVAAIAADHGLAADDFRPLGGSNLVAALGGRWVVKLFPPFLRFQWQSERLALRQLAGRLGTPTPELVHEAERDGWHYLVMTRLEGTSLEEVWPAASEADKVALLGQIGALIAEVHRVPVGALAALEPAWDAFLARQLAGCRARHERLGLPEPLRRELGSYLERAAAVLPRSSTHVLLTGEYTPENLLVTPRDGAWRLAGLLDFGDVMVGAPDYDLVGPGSFLAAGRPARLRALLLGYGYGAGQLTPALRQRLMALLLLHRYSDLDLQIRIDGWRDRVAGLDELEALLWRFAEDA